MRALARLTLLLICLLSTSVQASLLLRLDPQAADSLAGQKIPKPIESLLASSPGSRITFPGGRFRPDFPVLQLHITEEKDGLRAKEQLLAASSVTWVHENRSLQLSQVDSLFPEQWGLEWIRAAEAWDLEQNLREVLLGIVDSGIDPGHPDLRDRLWCNPGEDLDGDGCWHFIEDTWQLDPDDLNGLDDDGNGYVDDLCGYDFVDMHQQSAGGDDRWPDPLALDEHGHGTAVAGIAAAERGSGSGMAGLAGSCSVVPLRVANRLGSVEEDDLAAAVLYAVDAGLHVLNLSLGDPQPSALLEDLVRYAAEQGLLLVASAGNSGNDSGHYPSDYPQTISVGAVELQGQALQRASFSCYGAALDLVAPGAGILSCSSGGGWSRFSGTSMAAPFVSAALCMALARDPDLQADNLASRLRLSCLDLGPEGPDHELGAGLLDVPAFLLEERAPSLEIHSPLPGFRFDPTWNEPFPLVLSARGDAFLELRTSLSDPDGVLHMEQSFAPQHRDTVLWLDPADMNQEGDWLLGVELQLEGQIQDRRDLVMFADPSPPQVLDSWNGRLWYGGASHTGLQLRVDDPGQLELLQAGAPIPPQLLWRDEDLDWHALLEAGLQSAGWRFTSDTGHQLEGSMNAIEAFRAPHIQPDGQFVNLPAGRMRVLPESSGFPEGSLLLVEESEAGALVELAIWECDGNDHPNFSKSLILPQALYPIAAASMDEALLLLASGGGLCVLWKIEAGALEELGRFAGQDAAGFLPAGEDAGLDLQFLLRSRDPHPEFSLWSVQEGAQPTQIWNAYSPFGGTPVSWDAPTLCITDLDGNGASEMVCSDASGHVWGWELDAESRLPGSSPLFQADLGGVGPGRHLQTIVESSGEQHLACLLHVDQRQESLDDPGLWRLLKLEMDDLDLQVEEVQRGAGWRNDLPQGLLANKHQSALLLASDPGILRLDSSYEAIHWLELPGSGVLAGRREHILPQGLLLQTGVQGREWILLEDWDELEQQAPVWSVESRPLDLNRLWLQWQALGADSIRLWSQTADSDGVAEMRLLDSGSSSWLDSLASPGETRSYQLEGYWEDSGWSARSARLELQGEAAPQLLDSEWNQEAGWLRLFFDQDLDPSFPQLADCRLSSDGGESWWPRERWAGGDGRSMLFSFETPANPGQVWTLVTPGCRAPGGARGDSLYVQVPFQQGTAAPAILQAWLIRPDRIVVRFTEGMDTAILLQDERYRTVPAYGLQSILQEDSGQFVHLKLAKSLPPGQSLRLFTEGLRTMDGTLLQGEAAEILVADWSKSLNHVRIYPQPWRQGKHDEAGPWISGLPPGSLFRIYSLQGRLLRTLESGEGLALRWDTMDEGGRRLPPGVYVWLARSEAGREREGKLVLIR